MAHELKNPLNGIALNLDVIRTRAAKGGDASSVAQFAAAAQVDLETLVLRLDALLALARPARPPIDLHHTVRAFGVLYAAAATAEGKRGTVETAPASDTPVESNVAAAAARFVIGAVLDAAIERGWRAECATATMDGIPRVVVRRRSPAEAASSDALLGDDVRDVARRTGIGVVERPDEITITFPRLAGHESRA